MLVGVDLLHTPGCQILPVTITSGRMVRRSANNPVSVPKEALLALLVAAVEGRRPRVAKGCPAAAELLAELAAYRKRRDGRGRIRIEARGEGHHGDLAIVTALGLFAQALARAGASS